MSISRFFLIFPICVFTLVIPGQFAVADDDIRARLQELQTLHQDGLIPEAVYHQEVARVLGGNSTVPKPQASAQDVQEADPVTPSADTPKQPGTTQQLTPTLGPDEATPTNQPADTPQSLIPHLPQVVWGEFNRYFTVDGLHKEEISERDPLGSVRFYDALVFDMRARIASDQSLTLFSARFYDQEDLEFPRAASFLELRHPRGAMSWQPGDRGTGIIPLLGLSDDDRKDLRTVRVTKGLSAWLP